MLRPFNELLRPRRRVMVILNCQNLPKFAGWGYNMHIMGLEDEIRRLQLIEEAKKLSSLESQRKLNEVFARQQAQLEQEKAAELESKLERQAETRNRLQKAINLLEPVQFLEEVQKLWGKGTIDPKPVFYIGDSSRRDGSSSAVWFVRYAFTSQEEVFSEVRGRPNADALYGYDYTTIRGWKQITREIAIGVGITESYRMMANTVVPRTHTMVQSSDGKQGYSPLKSSTTEFLPRRIDLTKEFTTRLVAEHYLAVPLPQNSGTNLSTPADRAPWYKRFLG